MADTLRDLLVRLGVEGADEALDGLDRLDDAFGQFIDVGLKVVATGTAITAALVGIAVSAAGAGDAIDKGAQRATVSTDAYQELSYIATQLGTDIEVVSKAIAKQTIALAQLRDAEGPAGEALEDLGIRYEDLAGMEPDEQFLAIADALAKETDATKRLELATKIFGEDMAQNLLPVLGAGGEELARLAEEAHRLGFVLSEEDIAASVEFTDSMDQLWRMVGAVKNEIGLALIPVLTDLMGRLRDWWEANGRLVRSRIDLWIGVIAHGIEQLADLVELADAAVQATLGTWTPILLAIGAAVLAVLAGITALGGLSFLFSVGSALAAISAPVWGTLGLIALAVAQLVAFAVALAAPLIAAYLVLEDIWTFLQGGKSAVGEFFDAYLSTQGPLGSYARAVQQLIELGRLWYQGVQIVGGALYDVFTRIGIPLLRLFGAAVVWAGEHALALFGWYLENIVVPGLQAAATALELWLGWLEMAVSGLEQFLALADSAAAFVGGVLGIDLTGGTAGSAGGVFAGGTSGFAPSSGETLPGGGQVQAYGGNQTTIGGNSYTIHGVGISAEEAEELVRRSEEERARATAAALAGGEV